MPRGDGTGPFGQGPVTGKGGGRQGRIGGVWSGPTGYCICPKCGDKFAHTAGRFHLWLQDRLFLPPRGNSPRADSL